MQEKESLMVVWWEFKILSVGITVRHHVASLMMPIKQLPSWTEFSVHTKTYKNIQLNYQYQ